MTKLVDDAIAISMSDCIAHLIIVRHGQTEWNAHGQWQGWLDSPLTDLGRDQAKQVADILKDRKIDMVYSSDSGRAINTAAIIAEKHKLPVQTSEGLRERFYGSYEGLTTDQIEEQFPGTRYLQGRDTRAEWRPVGGESLIEVSSRLVKFLRELVSAHCGQTILLITHSGVVRVLDSLATHEDLEDIWDRAPANCCVFELNADALGNLSVIAHHYAGWGTR